MVDLVSVSRVIRNITCLIVMSQFDGHHIVIFITDLQSPLVYLYQLPGVKHQHAQLYCIARHLLSALVPLLPYSLRFSLMVVTPFFGCYGVGKVLANPRKGDDREAEWSDPLTFL